MPRSSRAVVFHHVLVGASLLAFAGCYSPRSRPASPASERADSGGSTSTDGRKDSGSADSPPPGNSPPDPVTDTDTSCKQASKSCVGDTLRTCSGTGMVTMTVCEHGCNAVLGQCNSCKPSARSCSGQSLTQCKADGSGTEGVSCPEGCDPTTNECKGACQAGMVWCNGQTLRECGTDGQKIDKEECKVGCNDVTKACNRCKPGERKCQDNNLVVCNADGTAETMMPCEQGCSSVRLECNQCKPNTRKCDGNTQVVCKSDGSGSDMKTCASTCNAASGECGDCQPPSVWCNANILRECTSAGTQVDKEMCASGCSDARKACNVCSPGEKKCDSGKLLTCRGDASGFTQTTCGAAGCNQARLACNVCEPNARACSDGNTLRTCAADGSGESDKKCPLGCDASALECRTNCPAGQLECGGACIPCEKPANGRAGCMNGACRITGCDMGYYLCSEGTTRCLRNGERCGNSCGDGFKLCGSACIADSKCCTGGSEGCPSPSCDSNSAISYDCRSGSCQKATKPCGGPSCANGVLTTPSCQQNQCTNGQTTCMFGCASSTSCRQTCGTGTFPRGNECVSCGGNNQPCCPNATSQCPAVCGSTTTRTCNSQREWDRSCPAPRACCGASDCPRCHTCNTAGTCVASSAADDRCAGSGCDSSGEYQKQCRAGSCDNVTTKTCSTNGCSGNTCAPPPPACGTEGAECCGSECGVGLTCTSVGPSAQSPGRCVKCGKDGQRCCYHRSGPLCDRGYGCDTDDEICQGGGAVLCGRRDEYCCNLRRCESGLTCRPGFEVMCPAGVSECCK